MSHHELKCHPEPFDLVAVGLKLHEIRVTDRDFKPGDTVGLRRWDPETRDYTGQRLTARIGHVSKDAWGLPPGLCVFTLLEVSL